jgi:magnesium transporter
MSVIGDGRTGLAEQVARIEESRASLPQANIGPLDISRRVATTSPDAAIADVLRHLRRHAYESLDTIYVVDTHDRLIGLVALPKLMTAAGHVKVHEVMSTELKFAKLGADREELLSLAHQNRLSSVPIVDERGRLAGCVTATALIDTALREHTEDVNRLAGILHFESRSQHALTESPGRRAMHRLPWLLVGLVGSVAATLVMAGFEDRIASHVAIAFFVPAIVYLADAIGTQSEAVTVRGLALLKEPHLFRLLLGELAAGFLIGLGLGVVAFGAVLAAMWDLKLALAVALAICIAGSLAAVCGLFFPWLLSRFRVDPAFASGPVATVVQDVLSLLVYFTIIGLMVPAPTSL